jgi:hypothetical protein
MIQLILILEKRLWSILCMNLEIFTVKQSQEGDI